MVITGGTGGIGAQMSRDLSARDYEVWMVGRNAARGQRMVDELGPLNSRFFRADLGSQTGVGQLAREIQQALGGRGLSALINNVGVVTANPVMTSEGVELTYAVNYLHPLLLSALLLPQLAQVGGKVIQTSTGYHHLVRVRQKDLDGRRWDSGMNVYGRAKLLSVLVGDVVGQAWAKFGVGVHFADPGMAETPLTKSMGADTFPWYGRFLLPLVKQIQKPIPLSWCASSAVHLVTALSLPTSGAYVLPGPILLPRPLVGFDFAQGTHHLRQTRPWLLPAYREALDESLADHLSESFSDKYSLASS